MSSLGEDFVLAYWPYYAGEMDFNDVDLDFIDVIGHFGVYPGLTGDPPWRPGGFGGGAAFTFPKAKALLTQVDAAGRRAILVVASTATFDDEDDEDDDLGHRGFLRLCGDDSTNIIREQFVDAIVTTFLKPGNPELDGFHYWGVDLDWEWPTTGAHRLNFARLIAEFRSRCDQLELDYDDGPWTVSVTPAANDHNATFYPITETVDGVPAIDNLAWVMSQTYNLHGGQPDNSAHTGHDGAIFSGVRDDRWHDPYAVPNVHNPSLQSSLEYWTVERGVPRSKLRMGIGLYGHIFFGLAEHHRLYEKVDDDQGTDFSSGYAQLRATGDSAAWTPDLFDGQSFASYRVPPGETDYRIASVPSIANALGSVRFALAEHVAGTAIWRIGHDVIAGEQEAMKALATMDRGSDPEDPEAAPPSRPRSIWLPASGFTVIRGATSRSPKRLPIAPPGMNRSRKATGWVLPVRATSILSTAFPVPADCRTHTPITVIYHWARAVGNPVDQRITWIWDWALVRPDVPGDGELTQRSQSLRAHIVGQVDPPSGGDRVTTSAPALQLVRTAIGSFEPGSEGTIRAAVRRPQVPTGSDVYLLGVELQYAAAI